MRSIRYARLMPLSLPAAQTGVTGKTGENMSTTSMLYTMGMALDRAAERGYGVRLLVDGQWVEGKVAANDGVGVVVECTDSCHTVVKADRIAAVEIFAESPYRRPLGDGSDRVPHGFGIGPARPMPGPRHAGV